MSYLGVFKIFLVRDSSAFCDLGYKLSKFLVDDIFNFLVVMSLNLVTMTLLVINKVVDFICFWHSGNEVCLFDLHFVKNFVYVHVSRLEIRAGLDQGLSQLLPSLLVSSVANIAFPKTENLTYEVVFEKFHGG